MFFGYDVMKRERSEERAYDCGFLPYHNKVKSYTQLMIGDNDLNNHNNNVLAMLLQSCKYMKTRNGCVSTEIY